MGQHSKNTPQRRNMAVAVVFSRVCWNKVPSITLFGCEIFAAALDAPRSPCYPIVFYGKHARTHAHEERKGREGGRGRERERDEQEIGKARVLASTRDIWPSQLRL
mmetsp:Transcript_23633/g.33076  ORF Transcript_23633/g.33076 Transcript_23633/m.33076 type:complete len:106 (+) Transcript_23633:157-474(+)